MQLSSSPLLWLLLLLLLAQSASTALHTLCLGVSHSGWQLLVIMRLVLTLLEKVGLGQHLAQGWQLAEQQTTCRHAWVRC